MQGRELEEMCIERVATWRDRFSYVTWLLDAIFSPNVAQPKMRGLV